MYLNKIKTIYGMFSIVLGLILMIFIKNGFLIPEIIVLMIPAICLCIPMSSIRENKKLGVFFLVIVLLFTIISFYCYFNPDSLIFVNDGVISTSLKNSSSYLEMVSEIQYSYFVDLVYCFVNLIASLMFLLKVK